MADREARKAAMEKASWIVKGGSAFVRRADPGREPEGPDLRGAVPGQSWWVGMCVTHGPVPWEESGCPVTITSDICGLELTGPELVEVVPAGGVSRPDEAAGYPYIAAGLKGIASHGGGIWDGADCAQAARAALCGAESAGGDLPSGGVSRPEPREPKALAEAIELAEEGWAYASDYFREKWEFEKRIGDLRATLSFAVDFGAEPHNPEGDE